VGQHVIEVRGQTPASRPAVWRVLANSSGWKEWGIYSDVHRERDGDLTPEGVGAIRVYRFLLFKTREEITEFDEQSRFGYRILSGFPTRDYNANVVLKDLPGGGTQIDWHAVFDSRPPGTGVFVRLSLLPYISSLVKKVGRVAEGLDGKSRGGPGT
jgi:Polyketide cyclase / dehydrase and lipid transport